VDRHWLGGPSRGADAGWRGRGRGVVRARTLVAQSRPSGRSLGAPPPASPVFAPAPPASAFASIPHARPRPCSVSVAKGIGCGSKTPLNTRGLRYNRRVPLPALPPERFAQLDRIAQRFMAANRVGIVVGLVLTPLIFGGIAVGLWSVIPDPAGMLVGGSIAGAGLLLLLFLLWYRQRTFKQSPFAAWVTIQQWNRVRGRHGEQSFSVVVAIEQACPISPAGYGAELERYRGQSKSLILTSEKLFEAVPAGFSALLVCMPTTEVVAIDVGQQLISA